MRNGLFNSVLTLTLFYWIGGLLFFFFTPPDRTIELLRSMPGFMRPDNIPDPGTVVFWKATALHVRLLMSWTVPLLQVWAGVVVVGLIAAAGLSRMKFLQRKARLKRRGRFRGMSITIGKMFRPPQLKRNAVPVRLKGLKINEKEQAVLADILGMLAAHPNAYAGIGHAGKTLHEHTLGVVRKILKNPDCTGEMVIVAAAHDIGKITSFKKDEQGEWQRVRMHAQESARLLATLDSWHALPYESRERIRMAIKYEHCPDQLPGIDPTVKAPDLDPLLDYRARKDFQHPLYDRPGFRSGVLVLIQALRDADGMQTAEEKREVLATIEDLPEFCYKAFLRCLPELRFYVKGAPRDQEAMVWRSGQRLFLSEAKMRDLIMAKAISPEYQAALGGNYRGPKTIHPFTWNLVQAFDKRGLTVREGPCFSVNPNEKNPDGSKVETPPPVERQLDPDMPLWDVFSGTIQLNGVIAIDVNPTMHAEIEERASKEKAPFRIVLRRPHGEGEADKKLRTRQKEVQRVSEDMLLEKAIKEDIQEAQAQARAKPTGPEIPGGEDVLGLIELPPKKEEAKSGDKPARKKPKTMKVDAITNFNQGQAAVPQAAPASDGKDVSEGDQGATAASSSEEGSPVVEAQQEVSARARSAQHPDQQDPPQPKTVTPAQQKPGASGGEGSQGSKPKPSTGSPGGNITPSARRKKPAPNPNRKAPAQNLNDELLNG